MRALNSSGAERLVGLHVEHLVQLMQGLVVGGVWLIMSLGNLTHDVPFLVVARLGLKEVLDVDFWDDRHEWSALLWGCCWSEGTFDEEARSLMSTT